MIQTRVNTKELDQKILESLAHESKTRKDFLEFPLAPSAAIDKALGRLIKQGKIEFTMIDTRKHYGIAKGEFVRMSQPKVRLYSLKKAKEKETHGIIQELLDI